MQASHRVMKNTGILYARMGITIFISLYVTRILMQSLGISDFGLFNLIGGTIVMLTFLSNALSAATQRFMSYVHGENNLSKQNEIFNISVLLHIGIGISVVLLLFCFSGLLFDNVFNIKPDRLNTAKVIYNTLAISVFFKIISVPYDAVINSHENMIFVSILNIFESILKLIIALVLTEVYGDKLKLFGNLTALLAVVLFVIQTIYCHRKYLEVKFNFRKKINFILFKEISYFAGWSLLGSITGLISNYGQGIILNIFFGTLINAAQGVANQISGQVGAFSSTMLKALNPVIVKNEGAGNRQQMLKMSLTGSKISFALMSFFAIPILIEMPFILNIWLKKVPEFTVVFCRLLLMKSLVEQLFLTLSVAISATGNIKGFQIRLSALAIFPFIISYFFFAYGFPAYTLYIVLLAQVIIRSFFIILLYAKKLCGLSVSYFMKDVIFKNLLALTFAILLSLVPFNFFNAGVFRLVLTSMFFMVSYLPFLYFIGFNYNERLLVSKILHKLFSFVKLKLRFI